MIRSFFNSPWRSKPSKLSNSSFVIRSSDILRRINVLLEEKGTGIVFAYGNDLDEMKVFCDMNMIDYVVE